MPSIRLLDAVLLFLIFSVAALVFCMIVARAWREAAERRNALLRKRWEPVLYARMAGEDDPLPRLARHERLPFLMLWLHVLGYVRDEAAEALVRVGHDLRLSTYVLQLLDSRSDWKRVIGMQAAGTLRLKEARRTLVSEIAQNRPKSSLAAVRALLRIDPQEGLAGLQRVLQHPSWSPGAMVDIVKAAGPQAMPMLAALVLSALPGRARKLVRLIALSEDSTVLPALRERLQVSRDDEEIAAILHALGRFGGAEDRMAVVTHLTHANWLARMKASGALGLLGGEQDCDRLLPLLRDRTWWVRHRAAQSLLRLKGAAGLGQLRDGERDAYAREMLERVLAEGG